MYVQVMRQQFPNPADHWMVEEAERRRVADHAGRERLQKLHSRQAQLAQAAQQFPQYRSAVEPDSAGSYMKPHQFDLSEGSTSALSPHAADLYRQTGQSPRGGGAPSKPPPTHVMEHVEAPDPEGSRPARPIPDTIKQTLIQRVTSPKSPPGRRAASYSPPEPGPPAYQHHSPTRVYPTSHAPSSSQYTPYSDSVPHSYAAPGPAPTYQDMNASQQHRYPDSTPYNGRPVAAYSPPSQSSTSGYQSSMGGYPSGPGYSQHSQLPPGPPVPPYSPPAPHHDTGAAPMKPPRAADPGPSRAEQVIVNGRQRCAHCEQALGEQARRTAEPPVYCDSLCNTARKVGEIA